MTGIWFLVVSAGNLFTAAINGYISEGGFLAHHLQGANYEWFFIAIIVVFILVFMFVAPRLKERSYITDPYLENQVIADTNNL